MARLDELERKFEENPRRYFAPLANEYRKAGDAARAAELCQAQLPELPGHISGHIVLGQALYDAGDFAGARSALETALALDPENIVALRYLGDIARALDDSATAEQWYTRTLDADPYNEAATAALESLRAARSTAPAAPDESLTESVATIDAEPATETAAETVDASAASIDDVAPLAAAGPATDAHFAAAQPATDAPFAAAEPGTDDPLAAVEPATDAAFAPAELAGISEHQDAAAPIAGLEFTSLPDLEASPAVDVRHDVSLAKASPGAAEAGEPPAADLEAQPAVDADDQGSTEPDTAEIAAPEPPESTADVESQIAMASSPDVVPDESERFAGDLAVSAPQSAVTDAAPAEQPDEAVVAAEVEQATEPSPLDWEETVSTSAGEVDQPGEPSAPEREQTVSTQAADEDPLDGEEKVFEAAAPFVTETMADLYMEQGYPHEALELLLQLAEQRPDDESLRGKIAHIESVIIARRDAAVAAARAERVEQGAASEPAPSAEETELPELAQPSEQSPALPPPEPPAPAEPRTMRELFARMNEARPRAAGAAAPRPRLRSDFLPLPDLAQHTAGDATSGAFAPQVEAAQPVARTSGPHPTFDPSTADISDFDAWLRGLKGS